MEAFIRALERRHEEGKPLDRHSVASFFVSRVDTEVDKRLEALGRTDLAGPRRASPTPAPPTAPSSAVFDGERFAALREAGCPVQRPLWASTGVKNPPTRRRCTSTASSARDTVNTMPLPTLTRGRARAARSTGATAAEDPTADLDALREAGIDLDDVTDKLLRDGIDAFVVPMAKLLDGIERKREAIVTGRPDDDRGRPAGRARAAGRRPRCARAADEDVVRRIWHRDGTLWAPAGTPEVTDRLGWLTSPRRCSRTPTTLEALRRRGASADGLHRRRAARHGRLEPRARGVPALASATPGGAAPARARLDAAGADRRPSTRRDRPRRRRCSSSPRSPAGRSRRCRSSSTSTRCSATARTSSRSPTRARRSPSSAAGARLPARVRERPRDRRALLGAVVLRARAGRAGRRRRRAPCSRPREVGGVPNCRAHRGQLGPVARARARRAGARRPRQADVRRRRAARARSACGSSSSSPSRPASRAAASCRSPTSRWSTPDAYGADRVFLHLATPRRPTRPRRARSPRSRKAGHPTITVRADGPGRPRADLLPVASSPPRSPAGCWRSTRSTSPTCRRPRTTRSQGARARARRTLDDGDLDELLGGLEPPGYVAILGYLPYSDEIDAAVAPPARGGSSARTASPPRSATARATCTRPASSTRAARPPARFLADRRRLRRRPAESRASRTTFRTLIRAQADGDLQTLRDHGLDAVRVRGPGD